VTARSEIIRLYQKALLDGLPLDVQTTGCDYIHCGIADMRTHENLRFSHMAFLDPDPILGSPFGTVRIIPIAMIIDIRAAD
jgi:hypothetical protein